MAQSAALPAPRGNRAAARPAAAQPTTTAESSKWLVLVAVIFGAFVSILDQTIVNTALPKMQAVFGANLHQISYVVTGYTLAQGAAIPATAYLANRFGSKRVYVTSLAAFTLGSALCGLAPNTIAIIVFRVVQGVGGAALFPLTISIIFSTFAPAERGLANAFLGIPILFAPAIGPTVGGYLVQYADWRWIFYVNVPIGILGVVMGLRLLRDEPSRPGLPFDLRGFLIVSAGLALLLYGTSNLSYDGWGSAATVSGPVILATALLLLWIPLQLRARSPLLDLRLFRLRNYTLGNLISVLGTVVIFGPSFLLPQYLQNLRGLGPYASGLLLAPQGFGTVLGAIISGVTYNRLGPRVQVAVATVLTIASLLLMANWLTTTSPYGTLPWLLMLNGFALPFLLQSSNTASLDGVPAPALANASTLSTVVRNAMAALSIALLANVLQTQRIAHNADLASGVSLANPATAGLYNSIVGLGVAHGLPLGTARGLAIGQLAGAVAQQAAVLAYQDIFRLVAVICAPIIILGLLLRVRRSGPAGEGGIPGPMA